MNKLRTTLSAVLLTAAAFSVQAVPLSDLFRGQSLEVGDKLFDNWSLEFAESVFSGEFDEGDFDIVDVTGSTSGNDVTLSFFFQTGDFAAFDGDIVDINFMFDVTVLDPMMEIVGVSAEFTEVDIVGDDFLNYAGLAEGVNAPYTDPTLELDTGFGVFSDSSAIPGADSLTIDKNIIMFSDVDGGVDIFEMTQTFTQAPKSVPTPLPLAMIALGMIGLGWMRRRA